jgi:hypothetical protein
MFPQLEDLAIVSTLTLEHAACIVKRVGEHMDPCIAPGHHLTVEPDPAVAIVERALKLCHADILTEVKRA